jgi:hypothetical protein
MKAVWMKELLVLTAHIKLNNCGHEYDYADFKPILYTIPFAFSSLLLNLHIFGLWNFKDLTNPLFI